MNPVLNKRFHSKISKLGLDKIEIVQAISNGRTNTSKELHDIEVIEWLNTLDANIDKNVSEKKECDRLRKKLIAKAAEAGWNNPIGVLHWAQRNGYWDMKTEKNITKDNVNQYDSVELKKIINRFERQVLEKTVMTKTKKNNE